MYARDICIENNAYILYFKSVFLFQGVEKTSLGRFTDRTVQAMFCKNRHLLEAHKKTLWISMKNVV